ncbi:MAG: hypothetical protein ACFFFT_00280 [Candidatus Thorarchaeota archaeon]
MRNYNELEENIKKGIDFLTEFVDAEIDIIVYMNKTKIEAANELIKQGKYLEGARYLIDQAGYLKKIGRDDISNQVLTKALDILLEGKKLEEFFITSNSLSIESRKKYILRILPIFLDKLKEIETHRFNIARKQIDRAIFKLTNFLIDIFKQQVEGNEIISAKHTYDEIENMWDSFHVKRTDMDPHLKLLINHCIQKNNFSLATKLINKLNSLTLKQELRKFSAEMEDNYKAWMKLSKLTFNIVVFNDFKEVQNSLFSNFSNLSFKPSYYISIGYDILIKNLTINDYGVSMRIWVPHMEERFRFLLTTSLKKFKFITSGILIMCDITREIREIDIWLKNILSYRDEIFKDYKIHTILVGYITNDEKPKISYEEIRNLAKSYKLDGYHTCNLQTGENIEIIFATLARNLMRRFPNLIFKVNEFITLKLEHDITSIYIKDKRFMQCKRLVLQIPPDTRHLFEEIESIDEAVEVYKKSLWINRIVEGPIAQPSQFQNRSITPEQEFWGHCSNIQAWAEHDYDTRLLHSNLSFPLLKGLSDAGDLKAKTIFKEEIAQRLESGYPPVVQYLIIQGYLDNFTSLEFKTLIETTNLIKIVSSQPKILSNFIQKCTKRFPTILGDILLKILELPEGKENVMIIFHVNESLIKKWVLDLKKRKAKKYELVRERLYAAIFKYQREGFFDKLNKQINEKFNKLTKNLNPLRLKQKLTKIRAEIEEKYKTSLEKESEENIKKGVDVLTEFVDAELDITADMNKKKIMKANDLKDKGKYSIESIIKKKKGTKIEKRYERPKEEEWKEFLEYVRTFTQNTQSDEDLRDYFDYMSADWKESKEILEKLEKKWRKRDDFKN